MSNKQPRLIIEIWDDVLKYVVSLSSLGGHRYQVRTNTDDKVVESFSCENHTGAHMRFTTSYGRYSAQA
jgi:hypothetical protein